MKQMQNKPMADPLPGPPVGAAAITRGVRRHLFALGIRTVTELSLSNGRRADIVALSSDGHIHIIEVKSSRADYASDQKWPDYQPFCDAFSFAVDRDFPDDLVPGDVGLLIADAYDAVVVRPPKPHPLPAARRKAMVLRFAGAAADRLLRAEDPDVAGA